MKILILNRDITYGNFGGDLVYINELATSLRVLGHIVDVRDWNDRDTTIELARQADIIHLFSVQGIWTFPYYQNIKDFGKPVILSTIYIPQLPQYMASSDQQLAVLNGASAIITTGERETQMIEKELHWKRRNTYHLINGSNAVYLNSNIEDKEHMVLAVGRIGDRKNFELLANACSQEKIPLVIVGPIPHKGFIDERALADKLIRLGATLTGMIPTEELAKYYAKAKIVALLSKYETDGMVAYEGAFSGCNLLLSTETGSAEQLQRYSTVRVLPPTASVDDVATALRYLLTTPNTLDTQKWALENATWEKVGKETLQVYENARVS